MLQLINAISPLAICVIQCLTIVYVASQTRKIIEILGARKAKEIIKMVRKLLQK